MSDRPTVIELLAAVMAEVQSVRKGQRNIEQGYNFRGIDAVVNAVGPALRKHGVVPVPVLRSASYRDVTTSRGKPSRESTVEVAYRFYGPAGDVVEAVVPGEAMDFGDKGVAKAMSVAYRIVLLQMLCIPTDEPDADSQSYERGRPEQRQQPEWDEAEQEVLYDGWSRDIAKATRQDLAAISGTLQAMSKRGELSPAVYQRLKREGLARRSELAPEGDGHDSTGDGDGGGAEPSTPSQRPGPGGEGAGERGPGGDGEAGRVRPGVQPGVPRGAGGGGPAQTSRGRRDAPAAVGG